MLNSFSHRYMNKFDVCIIDEASQCIEPWSMIPLLFDINSLILVGDSQQLPAVVLSTVSPYKSKIKIRNSIFTNIFWLQVGRDNNLERSLFTRLQEICADVDHKPNSYSLCQQYRMHPDICHWSNNYFYHKRLVSAPNMIDTAFQLNPYGVLSLDFLQSCNDGVNYRNSDEAKFITDLLKIIVRYADPKHHSYGIITPYSTQRRELQTHIKWALSTEPHHHIFGFINPISILYSQHNAWAILIQFSRKHNWLIPRTGKRHYNIFHYKNGRCWLSQ